MDGTALSLLMFAALVGLLALAVPVGLAMLIAGGLGYAVIAGAAPLLDYMATAPWHLSASYSLSVIPLFLLMGQFATQGGLSRALFGAANAWLGHRRGGMAMAAVGACGGFGAICGSSLATAATMAHVSLPEMKRRGYDGSLACGALAAGGTLGILIPPSVILVIYALLTEQSIGALFIAAVIPGLLAVGGYMAAIAVAVRLNPDAGPAGPRHGLSARLRALAETGPVLALFALVIGGIYGGLFTPTEGAAVGAAGTALAAAVSGRMSRAGWIDCLLGTAKLTAMVTLILIGADLYNAFLALSRLPMEAAGLVAESGWPPLAILGLILAFYLVAGCLMDSMSMILLTVPVFHPIVMGLDFGLSPDETAIWFGILVLIVVEVGLITPPMGMNIFVIQSFDPGTPLTRAFRGVVPFLAADAVRVALLVAFPGIALAGLTLMGGGP
ncbi:TRAP transporter large permease [Caenispirillum salinarum]|uniref:TRAP transporter large permease n=1 Tax=Caenispirillum salinarum TaxID=859058 RepID=UPI00384E1F76